MNTQRSRRRNCRGPLSALLLLMAVSAADSFSLRTRIPANSHVCRASGERVLTPLRATKLNYSSSDQDESEERRNEHNVATAQVRTKLSKWFSRSRSKQESVDQYLEFLDKRYHRLHDKEEPEVKPDNKFSAWDWLMDSQPKTKPAVVEALTPEEDALYVLGVAELASEQLLQKHQLVDKVSIPKAVEEEPVIDAVVLNQPRTRVGMIVDAGSSVLKRIGARRRALVEYQNRKLTNAARFTAKNVVRGPAKAATALWNYGGGRKTVGLSASVLVAAFFVLRPTIEATLKAVVRERSLSA